MDIKCNVKSLRDAMAVVATATGGKGPGIFKNVFCTIVKGGVELYATDNESTIMITVEASGGSVGTNVLLPPRRLLAILNELSAEDVVLTVSDNGIRVKASGADFRLANESAAEFPPRSMFEGESFYRIPGAVLRRMVHRTGYAADIASTRYALGGVMFEFDGDKLCCVATDSRRLALCEAAVECVGLTGDVRGVVPSKALRLLDKLPEADIDVLMTDKAVYFRGPGFECSSRLVEGRFPRYRDVIPKPDGAVEVIVQAGAASSAVRQSQVVTTEESRAVAFSLQDNMIVIKAETSDVGSSEVALPVGMNGHRDMTVMLDPKYVLDFLKTLRPDETAYWRFIESDSAVVMTDGDAYTYVMMPVSADG